MLISLLVTLLVVGLIFYAITLIPLPPQFRPIVYIIGVVVLIVVLLQFLPVGAHGALV